MSLSCTYVRLFFGYVWPFSRYAQSLWVVYFLRLPSDSFGSVLPSGREVRHDSFHELRGLFASFGYPWKPLHFRPKNAFADIWGFFAELWRSLLRMAMMKYVVVCCSVLQCVCSVLQCGAVCYSVLQCVAVCCSVLQCVAVRESLDLNAVA